MLGENLTRTWTAVAAGVAIGCGLWLVLGPSLVLKRGDELSARLERGSNAILSKNAYRSAPSAPGLFGAGPSVAPTLRLDGIAKTGNRQRALIAVGGEPAKWFEIGRTQDGVTLTAVQFNRAVVDTITGQIVLSLGQISAPVPADPSPANPAQDSSPSGVRALPPLASVLGSG